MGRSINARRRGPARWRLLAFGGLLVTGVVACTATSTLRSDSLETGVLADVRVDHDADATRVTLVGLEHPVYTAFQQQSPDRIVVDLASVEPEGGMEPLEVYDGLVEEVNIAPFSTGTGDAMTRVEISLAGPADYVVNAAPEGLEVLVEKGGAEPGEEVAQTETPAEDPWAIVPMDEASPAAEGWTAPRATELVGVEAEGVGAGSGAWVRLRANGTIESAVSFTLEHPDRLVVDLPSMVSLVEQEKIQVGSAHVARVRVGKHPDRVRVVIDAGGASDALQGRRVVPAPDGLLVTLGDGELLEELVADVGRASAPAESEELGLEAALDALRAEEDGRETPTPADDADLAEVWGDGGEAEPDFEADFAAAAEPAETPPAADLTAMESPVFEPEPEPALPAAVAEVVPEETPAQAPVPIFGVELDTQEKRDRIVVLGEKPVDFLVYEPDADTVVLSIEGAVIEPEAAVRIAPEKPGPVSLVTAFAQPDVATPEVRVVIKRAADLKPQVTRRGSLVVVDFPREGRFAEKPPVLAAREAETPAAPASKALQLAQTGLEAPSAAASPEAVPASLEPPAAIGILNEGGLFDGKEYSGRRISLDFKDVEIGDVLRLIAEVSDLNVIAGDEVSGRVTIRLVDVPWDQALDVILLTKSLGFVRVGNVLRIAPADVLKQEQELRLQERRALEKLEDLVVKLQPVNYANVDDVQKMTQRLLSERGTVNVDKRTNTLILKDIPSVIDEATALVKAIDTQTPQVMIEAKIVEANLDFRRELGSTWAFGAQPLVDGFDPGSAPRRDLGGSGVKFHDNGLGNNAVFSNPITAAPTGLFNLATFLLDEKLNLELQLQAAEVNGDGKVISSPRLVTLDNSKATIEQGVSIPFQTFENGDAQLEFVDAVLKLEVTPHITADQSIIMEIQVSRNAPDDTVVTLTGSPAIAKNQVKTETLVPDGQTLVLGGIYVVNKSQRQQRVPYLHKIPILGSMFRSDEVSDVRKELLIFVQPKVVESEITAS